MTNNDLTPKSKVAAGGVAGAISIVLIFIGQQIGLDIPAEVASAFTTILTFGAAYFKKDTNE